MELLIEKIQDSEIDEIASLLMEAFKTNPAYSIIFKNKKHLESGLLWLFKTNLLMLNKQSPLTNVIKEKNTGEYIGTFTIIPPQKRKVPIAVYTQIGLPQFIWKFGVNALTRMLNLDKHNKRLLTKSIQCSDYYYLSMVVVKKKYRGTGVGTFALTQAIEELQLSRANCNWIGLTTQLPENITFYSRLGFELLDKGITDFEGDKYFNSNMKLNIHH